MRNFILSMILFFIAIPASSSEIRSGIVTNAGYVKLMNIQVNSPSRPFSPGGNKNPLTAFICSLVLPGLGQCYNGQLLKGITITVGIVITIFNTSENNNVTDIGYFGIGLTGGVELWNLIDAPVTANFLNKNFQNKQSLLRDNNNTKGRKVALTIPLLQRAF